MTGPRQPRPGQHRAVLSVGSNLGDRLGTLQGCVQAIGGLADTDVLAISPVYETAPVGGPAQPDYLNAVLIVATALGPRPLLAATQRIEADFGRVRPADAVRFGPRTLDIDIISYDEEISDDPVLTLPHPRAHERAFVLAPWHDLDPAATVPGRGPVPALLAALPAVGRWRGGRPRRRPVPARPGPGRAVKPTRVSTLVVVALVCAGLGWLLLRSLYAKLPPLPWTGVPALLIAAMAEAWTGRDLKTRIAGQGIGRSRPGQEPDRRLKPVAPMFVSRMVALAKASSLAAAIIAGVAGGFDVYLSGSLSASVPREDALTAVVTFAAAVVLVCAALYLENCCRVPEDQDRDEREAPASSR